MTTNTAQQKHIFRFKPGFFLLCCFLFVICCTLGIWQLKRYDFKKNILQQYQQQFHSVPTPFSKVEKAQQYQHVAVQGDYLNDMTMYVQNQFYQDKQGYEVLTPFQVQGQSKLLLIDRGWIPVPKKNNLLSVAAAKKQQQINGHIKLLNEYQFILGDNILRPGNRPLVMQKIQIDELEKITGKSFYPFILRLDAENPDGFVRDWVITSVTPERHLAYAVQWFAFAAILLIAFICFCFERAEGSHAKKS